MEETSTQSTVYSSVTATLSHQVVTALPGTKIDTLCSFLKQDNVAINYLEEPQIYSLTGTLNDILKCEACLRTWIADVSLGHSSSNVFESLTSNGEQRKDVITDREDVSRIYNKGVAEKCDMGVNCDILKAPVVTRSGRIVKQTPNSIINDFSGALNELAVDELEADSNAIVEKNNIQDKEEKSKTAVTSSKRKRGRPRKIQKLDDVDKNEAKDEPMNVQHIKQIDETMAIEATNEGKLAKPEQLENDILQQSLTITKALENEIQDHDPDILTLSIPDSCDSASANLELKHLEEGDLDNDTELMTDKLGEGELDTVDAEIEQAVKDSLQNIYLNKTVANKEKVKKGKRSNKIEPETKKAENMKKWKQSYEKTMPFKYFCTKCSFKSKRESHLNLHKKLHLSNPDMPLYKCEQCSFTAIRQSVLQKHKVSHLEDFLICSFCDYKTNNGVHLSNHMKNCHEVKPDNKSSASTGEWYSCNICPYRTKQSSTYTKHYLSHGLTFSASEDGKVLTYKCNFCPYKTQRKEHLVRHKADRHGNSRPFLCDLCGMAFKRIDALAAHKVTHVEKSQRRLPYKCTTCKKAFKSRAHLKEHLAVHTSLRSHLCHICGASFKTRAVQKKHQQNIHFNPGSFKCNTCPKSFNTKSALQKHVQHHEIGAAYKAPKLLKKEKILVDPFGVPVQTELVGQAQGQTEAEGQIESQGQVEGHGDNLHVQEVQLQFHLQDYGNQVAMVTEDNQLVDSETGQTIQIIEGHEFDTQQDQVNGIEGQILEQVQNENIDENLTAIQTITLPSSQLRQLSHPIQPTDGEEIFIQNYSGDDVNSFVDPSQETVRQYFIPSSIDGQTSIIELDGNTTLIEEIQGAESQIGEVKNLGSLEGLHPTQTILRINVDGTEKILVANINSGDVENL